MSESPAPSLIGLLEHLLASAGHELIPDGAADRLLGLASRLPLLPWGGFEVTLGRDPVRVDQHVGLSGAADVDELLAARWLAGRRDARDPWTGIIRFLRLWHQEGSALHGRIERVGLEYDLSDPPLEVPSPALFWSFTGQHRDREPVEVLQDMIASLEVLLGASLPGSLLGLFERIAGACTGGMRVPHMGTMLSRKDRPVRVNVWGMVPSRIPAFLETVGWHHPMDGLEGLLARITPRSEAVTVGLSLGDRLLPVVGLECAPLRGRDGAPDWAASLEGWVADGWCTPAEKEALLAWPGLLQPHQVAQAWPPRLVASSIAAEPYLSSVIVRGIEHLKLDYRPGREPAAKAYLSFNEGWIDLREPRAGRRR